MALDPAQAASWACSEHMIRFAPRGPVAFAATAAPVASWADVRFVVSALPCPETARHGAFYRKVVNAKAFGSAQGDVVVLHTVKAGPMDVYDDARIQSSFLPWGRSFSFSDDPAVEVVAPPSNSSGPRRPLFLPGASKTRGQGLERWSALEWNCKEGSRDCRESGVAVDQEHPLHHFRQSENSTAGALLYCANCFYFVDIGYEWEWSSGFKFGFPPWDVNARLVGHIWAAARVQPALKLYSNYNLKHRLVLLGDTFGKTVEDFQSVSKGILLTTITLATPFPLVMKFHGRLDAEFRLATKVNLRLYGPGASIKMHAQLGIGLEDNSPYTIKDHEWEQCYLEPRWCVDEYPTLR